MGSVRRNHLVLQGRTLAALHTILQDAPPETNTAKLQALLQGTKPEKVRK